MLPTFLGRPDSELKKPKRDARRTAAVGSIAALLSYRYDHAMAKSPDQLREDARAYRDLAASMPGEVLRVILNDSANDLERAAERLEHDSKELSGHR
jgi:hypothetical protein